jgi:hypothetical protein
VIAASPRRISAILWTINLSSIAGSVFSYVYLSYFAYLQTNSVLLSEAVLLAPMVIPVLLCLVINRIAGIGAPRQILAAFNIVGVLVALLTYAGIGSEVYVAIAGALMIGFLDAVQRVARTVAIKRYFSAADVKFALPITLTAQFMAGGLAGVGLGFYRNEVTPLIAGSIVTMAFGLAAVAAWLLPRPPQEESVGVQATAPQGGAFSILRRLLSQNATLRKYFFAFLIFVSVFQGFFNVSRVTLPTHVLNLPQNFVGYLQIISAMSALAGALLFVWLSKKKFQFSRVTMAGLSIISLGGMIGATAIPDVLPSYFLYFIYMFVWEILFFKYQSDVVTTTPPENMALVATFQYAGVYLGMIVTGILGGLITEQASLTTAALVFAVIYLVLMLLNAKQVARE